MAQEDTKASHTSPFEAICREAEDGSEYWSARDLSRLLGYTRWEKFKNAIERAEEACKNSEQAVSDHFHHMVKMIKLGKGGQREVEDLHFQQNGWQKLLVQCSNG
jgi:DNA-damage-inducible protein D